jgi:plastocyanin
VDRRLIACWLLLATATAAADAAVTGRVLDSHGKGVSDAVVFVQAPPRESSANRSAATMDQVDKAFVPGILPVVVGTRVTFPNRDQIHHHVYSFSRTKSFELPLYKGTDAPPVVFDKPGVVKVACNIHDWMSAIILVLPTPHFVVTDVNGAFRLNDLPEGSYDLVAWHERSRLKVDATAQRVTVDTQSPEVIFTLPLTAARARPAMRGARKDL